ncbi:MAG: T9SS type A sorting domain-containing protein [Calditrichaeota bacterium]|nr:T9SS type A sorting domain-containing protein [Calditrichota bacterium]
MRTIISILLFTFLALVFANPAQADPPILLRPIDDVVVDEDPGQVFIVDLDNIFADPDGRQIEFLLADVPRELNMEIDRNNALLFNPDINYNLPDGAQINVGARNARGEANDTQFRLVVSPVNDRPVVVEEIEDIDVNEDSRLVVIANIDDVFFDVDGDELTYNLLGDVHELNIEIDEDNLLFFEPDRDFNIADGIEITISAEDPDGGIVEDVFNLTVVPINDAPIVLNPIDDIVLDQDPGLFEIADLDDVFFDVDGDELNFNFIDIPEELNTQIDNDNILSINPDLDFNLPDGIEITVIAEDFEGEIAEDVFWLEIIPGNIDDWWVNEIEDVEVDEDSGETIIADLDEVFIFLDGRELVYWINGAPEEMNMEISENNILFINPDDNYNLSNGVDITVIGEDEGGEQISDRFRLIIAPVNDPPVVVAQIEDRVFNADPGRVEIVDLVEVFDDIDGDELWYSTEGDPDDLNMEIDDDAILSFEPEPRFSIPEGVIITVRAEDPDGSFAEDRLVITIREPELVEQVIELNQGWNLVSLNIIPEDRYWRGEEGPDVVLLMAGIVDVLFIVKDENGLFYSPRFNFNNIPFWDLQEAYQINVLEECVLIIEGIPIPLDEEIQLEGGWNLLGFAPNFELDASAPEFYVLSPIIENVLIAKDGMGRFMTPEFRFSNMPPWRPGQGYQVNVDADVAFVYPPEQEEELAFAVKVNPARNRLLVSTGTNMSLLLNNISGNNVQPGDRIEAFNSKDVIVGEGTIDLQNRCGLVIWGDDDYTESIDGMQDGESFRLVLSSGYQQLHIHVTDILTGSGLTYRKDEFTVLNVTVQPPLPEEFYLSTAYPNPFNSTTKISYGLPADANVSIQVFDIAGSLIETLISNHQTGGHHSAVWDAGMNTSGVYLVRIEAGQFNTVTKVVLTR